MSKQKTSIQLKGLLCNTAVAVSVCLAMLSPLHAETLTGRVVSVADGDTITVLDDAKVQHKIRLAGIDAPEIVQAFGNTSKKSLSDLVFGKQVTVETNKTDKYGRQIGKVLVEDRDANLEQVKRGLAWFYRQYQRELSKEDRVLYEAVEQEAKAARRGLWKDVDPTPPWEFRHTSKSQNKD